MIYPNLIIIKKLSGKKYVKYILLLKATKKLKNNKNQYRYRWISHFRFIKYNIAKIKNNPNNYLKKLKQVKIKY